MLLGYCQNALTLVLGFKFTQAKWEKRRAEILKYREAYRIHERSGNILLSFFSPSSPKVIWIFVSCGFWFF